MQLAAKFLHQGDHREGRPKWPHILPAAAIFALTLVHSGNEVVRAAYYTFCLGFLIQKKKSQKTINDGVLSVSLQRIQFSLEHVTATMQMFLIKSS